MSLEVPKWCKNKEQNKFCHGQLCSDCPKRDESGVKIKSNKKEV